MVTNSKEYGRQWRQKNKSRIAEYRRDWAKRKWAEISNFKRKSKVRQKTRYLLRYGNLTRDICAICGKKNAEIHHENYDEPYVIIWLCSQCHRRTKSLVDN